LDAIIPLRGSLLPANLHVRGSIVPALFDMLYREFCRARLVEMRKQLFLSQTNSPESTEADGNISSDGSAC
jgi:hypothetical protein